MRSRQKFGEAIIRRPKVTGDEIGWKESRMGWTVAQQKVIDTRNKNLLVSAAAGSGKTAVLVERIISMISEGEHPLDIDQLLVVTFTNAAAAEMRERIGKAIDAKLMKEPDNQHLQKQLSLLPSAQITTIHSFCLNVIRNYFHLIELDPSFKIAEEAEITLMKSDVVSELLERWYEEGREDFLAFIESYSHSKSDMPVEELILKLFSFSMSAPWPKAWIEDKKKMFGIKTLEELADAPWIRELTEYVQYVLLDLLAINREAMELCSESGGPAAYLPALISDRKLLECLVQAGAYEESNQLFSAISFDRLSGKKEEGVEPWKKDKVKELREEIKKGMKELSSQFFFQPPEEMLVDLQAVNQMMQVLFDLTLEFMEGFARKKEEKNLIDFNDLEHFALKILVDEKGELSTRAALELSGQFEEILIDEYQDSNMVQETILRSISREAFGRPNRFMVGDVKQSIYKFRLAMPELFMEKYGSYSSEDFDSDGSINCYQRIDLDKNFRSRKQVLEYVNGIFEQIMQKSIGGIIYDETAALKYGELYEEYLDEGKNVGGSEKTALPCPPAEVELLLVTDEETANEASKEKQTAAAELTSDQEASVSDMGAAKENEAEYTKKELEALVIAEKIKELTDPVKGLTVVDKNTKNPRPASYRDIVILLRSMTGWSEVFVNTLMQQGIPAYADTGTGYFETMEIMTLLNMLRIIDNPRQDIPLTGVLYSPIVGLTTTQLAKLRAAKRGVSMYTALATYAVEGDDEELRNQLAQFLDELEGYRKVVNYKPIHEMIQMVLDQTGYYYYVCTMPGGDRRKANIDMLISQAVQFEKGSYSGLFHFIRYIEKLHKYEVDFGEASTAGEQDNTVRIMSIHKSKGLEFPVVFAAGMGKQFNTQDLKSSIILHSDLGAGPEYVDSKLRTKVPTLLKKVIQKKVQVENLGEELRVLYVAMTRAKEKLILTGYMNSRNELEAKDFSFYGLMSAKSYLDWVLPGTVNLMESKPVINQLPYEWKKPGLSIRVLPQSMLLKQEITKQVILAMDRESLMNINSEDSYAPDLKGEINSRFNYQYPYLKEAGIKIKMTVSELKKASQAVDEEKSHALYQKNLQDTGGIIPDFIRQRETRITGTDRGTLYHKVLELLNLNHISTREDFDREIGRLSAEKQILWEDIEKLNLDYIYSFVCSGVAGRMRRAQISGKLFKERQFVIGIKAKEILPDTDSEELVLIQGIIDVYFEEEGELVLLDYKSDLVDQEQILVKRYQTQLDYYRRALEQMLNKRVKEMYLYSLPLGKEIRIDA